MPRTRANCQSCGKEITNMKQGQAKMISGTDGNGKPYRFFLHMDCYERDNQEAKERTNPEIERTLDGLFV